MENDEQKTSDRAALASLYSGCVTSANFVIPLAFYTPPSLAEVSECD